MSYFAWLPLICVGLGIAFLVALARRAGCFSTLVVVEKQLGPLALLYMNVKGPYSKTSTRFKLLTSMVIHDAKLVPQAEQVCMRMAGFYYDDPKVTKAISCRSSICYAANMYGNIRDIEGYVQNLTALSVCKSGELQAASFPESRCLTVDLPFYGSLSVLTAVFRAYPLLIREARSRLGKETADALIMNGILEVYELSESKMCVALPLTKRENMLPFY